MKSIRGKIIVSLIATVLIALTLVGVISVSLNYRSTLSTVEQMMEEIAVLAADRIEQDAQSNSSLKHDDRTFTLARD